MILCDIGNTTFHFKNKKKDFRINIKKNIKNKIDSSKPIYFISVNEKATKKLQKNYQNIINLKDLINFKTSYNGMGIDRVVVCDYISNGIIVDIGSAITVDVMTNKIHKGGFILPGLSSYKNAYPKISKKLLFKFNRDINLDKIPMDTSNAISFAVINSIVLPILKVYEEYKLPIYFTGGDANKILKYFKNQKIIYKKDLIFKSMKKIINRNKRGK
ncbi:MAG: type III pantothenate kinase [Campylobacterota bacterium]|nr:type III pantothenate kinase [Campylobacterota bacterium]